ncbi:hypothetical protein DFAR_330034 [Desulfarculales bacterium]
MKRRNASSLVFCCRWKVRSWISCYGGPQGEIEDGYELTAEVLGLKPEEIEVSLTGDVLTLRGEKKEEREEIEGGYHLVEWHFGSPQDFQAVETAQGLGRLGCTGRHRGQKSGEGRAGRPGQASSGITAELGAGWGYAPG